MTIGERLGRYLRHPASGILPDGAPLDAGSAMIAHANATELSAQNARLVGQQVGPGVVGYDLTAYDQWLEIWDQYEQPGADSYGQIPWSQPEQCVVFGPINAHAMTLDGRGFTPRELQVFVEITKGATASTTLTIMAVVTSSYDVPTRAARVAAERQAFLHTSPGDFVCQLDLTLSPVRPGAQWRCRPAGDEGTVAVAPLWLWVGWLSNNVASADFVHSISAFEVRS
jgi:hypothetical protein